MVLLPFWMKGLTPEMEHKAEIELGETPESQKRCLEELRQLINDEQGFNPLMEEAFLIRFLRARKYNTQNAFKRLKNYYDFKNRYSGTYTDLKPSQLRNIIEMNKVLHSPKRDLNGGAVFIISVGTFDVQNASPYELFATLFLCADIGIENEASQVCGNSIIFDFSGTSLRHLSHFSAPSYLFALAKGIQDCWPYRMNGIHFVRPPSYVGVVYNIIRPMLSKKLRDRIHFHGGELESLHAILPLGCLPKQLGGHLEENVFDEYRSIIFSKEPFVEKLNEYVYLGKPSPAYEARVVKEMATVGQDQRVL